MKPPSFGDTQLLPLSTDAAIHERITRLVGRAVSRQLWLVFLDDVDLQLPLLVPIEGLPDQPTDEQVALVLDRVREVMADIGASALIVVIERYAAATLTPADVAWAKSIERGCAQHGISLRARLLSHRSGVRWIADSDLVESEFT